MHVLLLVLIFLCRQGKDPKSAGLPDQSSLIEYSLTCYSLYCSSCAARQGSQERGLLTTIIAIRVLLNLLLLVLFFLCRQGKDPKSAGSLTYYLVEARGHLMLGSRLLAGKRHPCGSPVLGTQPLLCSTPST